MFPDLGTSVKRKGEAMPANELIEENALAGESSLVTSQEAREARVRPECAHEHQYVDDRSSTWKEVRCSDCGAYIRDFDTV
jgi:hypothetical protein